MFAAFARPGLSVIAVERGQMEVSNRRTIIRHVTKVTSSALRIASLLMLLFVEAASNLTCPAQPYES